MANKIKKFFVIAIIAVFSLVCVNIPGFQNQNTSSCAYAGGWTYHAHAYCTKCDPRRHHPYRGTSTTSNADAMKKARTKAENAGHKGSKHKVIVVVQY